MKISIYNEPSGGSVGGSEVSVAVLAEALSRDHEVEILHRRPTLTRNFLAEFADVDLSLVSLRCLEQVRQPGSIWRAWTRAYAERLEEERLTRACDVLISVVHEVPLYCGARAGILYVLFPFDTVDRMVPSTKASSVLSGSPYRWAALRWHRWKFKARLRSYRVKLAISDFSKLWTKRRWGIDCEVLYPPVATSVQTAAKTKRILSVGRFTTAGHGKNQHEMLKAFGNLARRGSHEWGYDCVGAAGKSEADVEFLRVAVQLGKEAGAHVEANLSHCQLRELFRGASIFWHAAGLNVDEATEPELVEHFGISTVEAMGAGCVPVVIDKGGQREIVQHGVSGFLWQTIDELEEYTQRLMCDPALLQQMSSAARDRARLFAREAYTSRFLDLLASSIGSQPTENIPLATSAR